MKDLSFPATLALATALIVACGRPEHQAAPDEPNPLTEASPAHGASSDGSSAVNAPRGPFGLSMISTVDGTATDIEDFWEADECGDCHERQFEEFQGSMHSAAHSDPLYRGFALMARREAGEEVYQLCAGCHSAAAVLSGLAGEHDEEKRRPRRLRASLATSATKSAP